MDDIEKLAAFGSVVPAWREAVDTRGGATGGLALAAVTFDLIERIGRDFEDDVSGLETDILLSDQGKAQRRQALAAESEERLAVARGHLRALREEAAAVRADAAGATDTSDVLKAAIWRWLDRLDPMQIEVAYRDAIAAGDTATADAIESLPSVHPARLAADRLATLQGERARAANPVAARRAAVIETAIADLEARLAAVEARIAGAPATAAIA